MNEKPFNSLLYKKFAPASIAQTVCEHPDASSMFVRVLLKLPPPSAANTRSLSAWLTDPYSTLVWVYYYPGMSSLSTVCVAAAVNSVYRDVFIHRRLRGLAADCLTA
jgi:endonuclease/exonuclease/phosphatase (EEP) superfamily protein YafD